MATANPKKVKKDWIYLRKQVNTDRTLLATWQWPRSKTHGYNVEWEYYTKDGIWFKGSQDEIISVAGMDKMATYDAPTLATRVRFRVKPISTAYRTNWDGPNKDALVSGGAGDGAVVNYWTAEWSAWVVFKMVNDPTPDVPDPPDISISGNQLTVKSTSYDEKTTHISFDIWMDDKRRFKITSEPIKLSANVASFTTTVPLGHRYKAKAAGYNRKHKIYSEYSQWSSDVITVPDQVIVTACYATSAESVKLEWDHDNSNTTGYEIEYATAPEYFDQSSQVSSINVEAVHPYAIVAGLESGKRWYFRVRAKNSVGESVWSKDASGTSPNEGSAITSLSSCILGTVPEAPTIWSSSSSVTRPNKIHLYWVHNNEDGSREIESEINIVFHGKNDAYINRVIKKKDDAEVNAFHLEIDDDSQGECSWKVRTKGITEEWGPWSEEATFTILVQPTLGIEIYENYKWLWDPFNFRTDSIYTAQGHFADPFLGDEIKIKKYPFFLVVTMYPMTQTPLEFNFSIYAENSYQTMDHVGQKVWVNAGDQVYNNTIPYTEPSEKMGLTQNQMSLMITPGDVILENYERYKLVITAVSNNSLSAEGEIIFEMDLEDEGLVPEAELGIDAGSLLAYIRPTCYDEEGNQISGVRMSVYRRQFDGGFQQIDGEVDSLSQTVLVDPHPNLNYARYRIVGYSARTGKFVYYDMPAYPVQVPEVIIQWDEESSSFDVSDQEPDELVDPVWSGSMLRLPWNVDTSENNSIDVELVEYIGREHPVSYYGTQVGQMMSMSVDIRADDEETLYSLRRLARYMGDAYVREPNGVGYWANVTVSFSTTHNNPVIPVTISATRVEGGM